MLIIEGTTHPLRYRNLSHPNQNELLNYKLLNYKMKYFLATTQLG